MDDLALLVDFGSTYTKVLAVDMDSARVLARAQAPTTVRSNLLDGLLDALERLTFGGRRLDAATVGQARKLGSSSAAGGLAILAVGLVPDLTLEAARKAALGAGGRVVGSYAFELDQQALDEIEASRCDIILLCGGIDGGNRQAILHNARMLASRPITAPVIVAGNRSAAEQVQRILLEGGRTVERTENVLPELDRLVVEPARAAIREIFIRNIVKAKGLEQAQDFLGHVLVPTPAATLCAAALLAHGHGSERGLGELMVVEIGGATTNVHSVASGESAVRDTILRGLRDPREMRTVEGDLGIRYNARTIVDVLGIEHVLRHADEAIGLSADEVRRGVELRSRQVAHVPVDERDAGIDLALARSAVDVAVGRHAGTLQECWGIEGPVKIQRGKDLRELRTVIGTGGIFAHHPEARRILDAVLANPRTPMSLRPKGAEFYLDPDYVLYGVGLLGSHAPEVALRMARHHLRPAGAATA